MRLFRRFPSTQKAAGRKRPGRKARAGKSAKRSWPARAWGFAVRRWWASIAALLAVLFGAAVAAQAVFSSSESEPRRRTIHYHNAWARSAEPLSGHGTLEVRLFRRLHPEDPVWLRTPLNYPFRSSDRVRMQVWPTRSGYLYLVVRGASGRVREIPLAKDGCSLALRVETSRWTTIPPRDFLQFDRRSGDETLFLILSPRRLAHPAKTALAWEDCGWHEADVHSVWPSGPSDIEPLGGPGRLALEDLFESPQDHRRGFDFEAWAEPRDLTVEHAPARFEDITIKILTLRHY